MKEMVGGLLRRAKKVVSRSSSSVGESSRQNDSFSTPEQQPQASENIVDEGSEPQEHSFVDGEQTPNPDSGVWLIDNQDNAKQRRGRTTCADIQNLSVDTKVHIEINDHGLPCNIPESTLLGTYMGVIARDPVLAPIAFKDWRNKGLEPFKKKMLAEVESKFAIPPQIRSWVLKSIGVRWRGHKTTLKSENWNNRPLNEILETVPNGVDAAQWAQLVTQWTQPEDQMRAAKNTENAKKQTCPHTMGRTSSVRRQKELAINDRLLLWKINRQHKDGSWSSDDAKQRWMHACEILAAQGLTPEDGNVEENEKVFLAVMGPEHSGRVRTAGFGVTPTKYFPQGSSSTGDCSTSSTASTFSRFAALETNVTALRNDIAGIYSFQNEMQSFMQNMSRNFTPRGGSETGGTNEGTED